MQFFVNHIFRPVRAWGSRAFQKRSSYYASHPLRVLITCIKTGLFAHLFTEYGYTVDGTLGASMLPTLEVMGDRVLISKHYRRGRDVKVGDMVTFRSVVDPEDNVIKRVIGLEGDYVLRNTPGSRNDSMIQVITSCLKSTHRANKCEVPEGHCWVIGDNLEVSRDSRHFGPMPLALVRGKVLARVFPFSERRWYDDGLQILQ
jgi:mitochondrial inner membrane protease subunit 1